MERALTPAIDGAECRPSLFGACQCRRLPDVLDQFGLGEVRVQASQGTVVIVRCSGQSKVGFAVERNGSNMPMRLTEQQQAYRTGFPPTLKRLEARHRSEQLMRLFERSA